MTRSATALGVIAVIGFSGCEPRFADVTFEGVPKCEGSKLTAEILLKLEGPKVSFSQRLTGDGALVETKMVAGKLYKLKAYKCESEPCETEKNFFHGSDVTAPEGKTGRVTLTLPGAPGCVVFAPGPAAVEDAGSTPDAG